MKNIEALQTRLQELNLERINLSRSFDQITGAMLEIENQIKALTPEEKPAKACSTKSRKSATFYFL